MTHTPFTSFHAVCPMHGDLGVAVGAASIRHTIHLHEHEYQNCIGFSTYYAEAEEETPTSDIYISNDRKLGTAVTEILGASIMIFAQGNTVVIDIEGSFDDDGLKVHLNGIEMTI